MKTYKQFIKNIKRGLQGWDKDAVGPGGEKIGDPKDIVKRAKSTDDETLKHLAKDDTTSKHSPRGLQKRVLDREIKKRGLND